MNFYVITGAVPIDDYPRILIDVSALPELKTVAYDQNLVVGAGITLSEFLEVLKDASTHEYFGYLSQVHFHVDLVAHIPVRNVSICIDNYNMMTWLVHSLNDSPQKNYYSKSNQIKSHSSN